MSLITGNEETELSRTRKEKNSPKTLNIWIFSRRKPHQFIESLKVDRICTSVHFQQSNRINTSSQVFVFRCYVSGAACMVSLYGWIHRGMERYNNLDGRVSTMFVTLLTGKRCCEIVENLLDCQETKCRALFMDFITFFLNLRSP